MRARRTLNSTSSMPSVSNAVLKSSAVASAIDRHRFSHSALALRRPSAMSRRSHPSGIEAIWCLTAIAEPSLFT